MLSSVLAWRPGGLARNTAYTGAWNLWRIVLQGLNLVALARLFGAEGYGVLAGTIALFATCGQFVGLGTGIALVRDSVRDARSLSKAYARTKAVYLATGLCFFLLSWPLGTLLLGERVPSPALAMIAFAELVAAPMLMPLVYRLQAQERMGAFGALLSVPSAVRLATTSTLLLATSASITDFALLYLAMMLAATLLAHAIDKAGAKLRIRWSDLRYLSEGLPYVLPGVSSTAGNELDKTILLRSAGALEAGYYAAAYRIMQAAALPVGSLMLAAVPRLFRSSAVTGRPQRIQALGFAALGYSIPVAALLWLLAPLAPWLLGAQFEPAVSLLRGLCMVLVATCMRQVILVLLTTSDLQRERNWIEVSAGLFSVGAMLAVIPVFSAWGAVVVLGVTDLLVVVLGGIALYRHRRQPSRFTS